MNTGRQQTVILGIGNTLMQDDGFGVHFLRWFGERWRLPPEADLVDGGTLSYRLLDCMSRCDSMIVIDAIQLPDTPGSLYQFSREEMTLRLPPPSTAHDVTFADVLCKADLMGECPEMTFLCIVPERWQEMGLEMTPLMTERFPDMERLLLDELKRLAVAPLRRPDHA